MLYELNDEFFNKQPAIKEKLQPLLDMFNDMIINKVGEEDRQKFGTNMMNVFNQLTQEEINFLNQKDVSDDQKSLPILTMSDDIWDDEDDTYDFDLLAIIAINTDLELNDKKELLGLLIDKGADLNKDNAMQSADGNQFNLLFSVAGSTDLELNDKKELLGLLINKGADLNKDNAMQSADGNQFNLLFAVAGSIDLELNDKKELLGLLIDKGADLNKDNALQSANDSQFNLLSYVVTSSKLKLDDKKALLGLLIDKGADLNKDNDIQFPDGDQYNLLSVILSMPHIDIDDKKALLGFLIDKGADPFKSRVQDNNRTTSFFYALNSPEHLPILDIFEFPDGDNHIIRLNQKGIGLLLGDDSVPPEWATAQGAIGTRRDIATGTQINIPAFNNNGRETLPPKLIENIQLSKGLLRFQHFPAIKYSDIKQDIHKALQGAAISAMADFPPEVAYQIAVYNAPNMHPSFTAKPRDIEKLGLPSVDTICKEAKEQHGISALKERLIGTLRRIVDAKAPFKDRKSILSQIEQSGEIVDKILSKFDEKTQEALVFGGEAGKLKLVDLIISAFNSNTGLTVNDIANQAVQNYQPHKQHTMAVKFKGRGNNKRKVTVGLQDNPNNPPISSNLVVRGGKRARIG